MYASLDPSDQRALIEMLGTLGTSPLTDYFSQQKSGALRRLSEECVHHIQQDLGDIVTDSTALFAGHAVLLNGIIYELFEEQAIKTLALTHVLGECGAIRVTTDDHGDAVAEVVGQVSADSHGKAAKAAVS